MEITFGDNRALVRFWSKVAVDDSGCWIWTAGKVQGYGKLKVSGRHWRAHRYSWEMLVGPIPDGLELDHLCRVIACVNPAHLEPVTHRENLRRGRRTNAVGLPCVTRRHLILTDADVSIVRSGKTKGTRRCRRCREEGTARRKPRIASDQEFYQFVRKMALGPGRANAPPESGKVDTGRAGQPCTVIGLSST